MYQIQQLTSDPVQTQTLVQPDGSTIVLTIRFRDMQYGWFIDQLKSGKLDLRGQRICVNPNILRQYKGTISFGLAVFTDQAREPTQLEDFSSGAFKMYILTPDEVQEYEDFLADG